ncbi:MAG: glycerol-3-phosphate acyltransferase [Lachnospiraceae bacterium]
MPDLWKRSQRNLPLLKMYAAGGTILGHNFPLFLQFDGGKGIAVTAGLVLSFDSIMAVWVSSPFLGFLSRLNYVVSGVSLVDAGIMIEVLVLGQTGHFAMSQPLLYELYVLTAVLTVMAYWKHRGNIIRLLHGERGKRIFSTIRIKNDQDHS